MSALLQAELLKLRTTRTFITLVAVSVVLSLLVIVLTTALSTDLAEEEVRELFFFDFTSLFILLLGVMGMAGEWRHRTITSSVLAAPDRVRLLGAKLLSYAIAGALLSLAVSLAIMVVGSIILASRDLPTLGVADLADVLWRNLVVAGLLGAFGVCVGGMVRNQVVAIVGLLIFAFAIEPVLIGLAPDVGRFGPTSGAPNGVLGIEFDDEEILDPALALLVMLAWVGAGFVATAALLRRRDLT